MNCWKSPTAISGSSYMGAKPPSEGSRSRLRKALRMFQQLPALGCQRMLVFVTITSNGLIADLSRRPQREALERRRNSDSVRE